jgi:predicted esterase
VAASIGASGDIVPQSNFDGKGLAPVGTFRGLGRYGTYDMAGNAKEWCFNQRVDHERYALGGSWGDPSYMFSLPDWKPPLERDMDTGFRCVVYAGGDSSSAFANKIISAGRLRDYSAEPPVSDELFQAYLQVFAREESPLNAEVDFTDDKPEQWRIEKISFDAGYGGERTSAYLFLPKGVSPPYQAVVLYPGAYAHSMPSSDNGRSLNSWDAVDFIIMSGRAALCPVYKSMYERADGFDPFRSPSQAYQERIVMWSTDLSRSLDYLETRDDIDSRKLGYVGSSQGALLAPIFLAQEKRFKVAVLRLVGLPMWRVNPPFDPFNYAPRVTIPVLILNGRHDPIFPYEISQVPFLRVLGTPDEDKRMVMFETGHSVYGHRERIVREVLGWLDHYLGPVR